METLISTKSKCHIENGISIEFIERKIVPYSRFFAKFTQPANLNTVAVGTDHTQLEKNVFYTAVTLKKDAVNRYNVIVGEVNDAIQYHLVFSKVNDYENRFRVFIYKESWWEEKLFPLFYDHEEHAFFISFSSNTFAGGRLSKPYNDDNYHCTLEQAFSLINPSRFTENRSFNVILPRGPGPTGAWIFQTKYFIFEEKGWNGEELLQWFEK